MDVKSVFIVTEKAGAFVAGRRNPGEGKELQLTETQAFYPLQLGEVERAGARQSRQPKGKTATANDTAE